MKTIFAECSGMRFLTVVFVSHCEFMAHFSDRYPNGAIFCPTKAKAGLRDKVIVDVTMPGVPQAARLCGQVISHSSGRGLWVHVDKQSKATMDYLKSPDDHVSADVLGRVHSRYPASIQVSCRIDEASEHETLEGRIIDLSRGGAFVSGEEVPMVGTRVQLDIGPVPHDPSRQRHSTPVMFRVEGRVAWVGDVDNQKGFGVRFDQRGSQGTAPLRKMLRRASETGLFRLP